MKGKNKSLIILLIIILPLLIILNVSPINSKNDDMVIDELNEQIINKKELRKPKSSGSWDNIYRIHIKNDNWSATDLPWIQNRTGTWEDPHIIENITISSSGLRDAILIEDSNQSFIIRNCTILNCGDPAMYLVYAAIKLERSCNGTIMDNNCSNNFGVGIFLDENCKNNTIFKNNCSTNRGGGISLEDGCHNNTIANNIISNNQAGGILFNLIGGGESCDFNNITGNVLFSNSYMGDIALSDGNYNNITKNSVKGVIRIIDGKQNFISENTAYGGQVWVGGNNHTVVNNKIYGGLYSSGGNLTFLNNKMYGCGIEIDGSLEECNSNNIDLSNSVNGLPLYYYANEKDLENINFSYAGNPGQIVLAYCEDSVIEDIIISNTSFAILLVSCQNIFIKNCNLTNNDYGIYLRGGLYNNITQNNITNNDAGIFLDGIQYNDNVDHNHVYENTISNNSGIGICISGIANYNKIENNTINHNYDGIMLYGGTGAMFLQDCTDNYITNNTLRFNTNYGIYIHPSSGDGDPYDFYTYVSKNNMIGAGIGIDGDITRLSELTISTDNMVNGKPVYYYKDWTHFTSATDCGQVILMNCKHSKVKGLNTSYTTVGVLLFKCENITVSNVNASYNIICGIYSHYSTNINIINNNCSYNDLYGIQLYSQNDFNISNNILEYNGVFGMYFRESKDIIVSGNKMKHCGIGVQKFLFMSILDEVSSYNIDTKNTVDGKPVYFYKHEENLKPCNFTDAGLIFLVGCNESLISNVDTSYGSIGVMLYFCENNTISNINSTHNLIYGFELYNCFNISIQECNISYNDMGIMLWEYANNNTFFKNNFTHNSGLGIYIFLGCMSNLVYCNRFINNTKNAADDSVWNNRWDNGTIGNYWDDYTGLDVIAPFGIGDTPYLIPGYSNSRDNYPIYNKGSVPPLKVIIIEPTADIYGPASLLINASIIDGTKAVAMINASTQFNISMTKSGSYWICYWDNISLYTSGDYNITIWAIDIHGNVNDTEFVIITIDTDGPSVLIIDPAAGTYGPASLLINASITDVTQAVAMINASTPFTISMTLSGSYWNCSWNNISLYTSGDYNITIWAIDNNGNVNATEYIVITIEIGGAPGLPAGDDDDDDDDGKDEFDIVEFLTSPIGLTIIGGSIAAVAIITIIKIKGSGKSRAKEIERIERIGSE